MNRGICRPCGEKEGKRIIGSITWNNGICGWCYEARAVTSPEDYKIKTKDKLKNG